MNEQAAIAALRAAYPIKEGSTPREITAPQQRAVNIIGALLSHAHKRGKRRAGKWLNDPALLTASTKP